MKKMLPFIGVVAASLAASISVVAENENPKSGSLLDAGDIRRARGFYSLVFYFTPQPLTPPEATARQLVEEHFPGMPVVTSSNNTPKPPFIAIETEQAPLENFPVPDAGYFKYAGRGLSADDIAAIRRTELAFRLILIAPKEDVWALGRQFTELGFHFAKKTGAFVWDSSTRECFSVAAWKEKRLDTWSGSVPRLPDQFTIHAYRVPETNYVRAITLGMEKFALPDLVIQQTLASDSRAAGNLINVTAQLLAENPVVENPAAFHVSLAALKNESLRTAQSTNLLKGATQETHLALVAGRREEGDPQNTLVELDFRNAEGRSTDERREAAFSQLWGSTDSVVKIRHNDAILAASKRAKEKVPELQRLFAKGLAPGERILLKAPFVRDDEGNEWMWVEVLQWPARGKVTGILQSDPHYVQKLRAGSRVTINSGEIFDYIYYKADGSEEGNETGRLMQP